MATHSSILAWRIPGTEEPVGLPSVGSHRVRNDWRDLAAAAAAYLDGEGNGTPLQYSCLEIPWTEEPSGLWSMGSLGVGHDWATSLSLFTFMHWRRQRQPTPVFLPGESQGRDSPVVGSSWWAPVYGVTQSWTRLKWLSSSSSSIPWNIINI